MCAVGLNELRDRQCCCPGWIESSVFARGTDCAGIESDLFWTSRTKSCNCFASGMALSGGSCEVAGVGRVSDRSRQTSSTSTGTTVRWCNCCPGSGDGMALVGHEMVTAIFVHVESRRLILGDGTTKQSPGGRIWPQRSIELVIEQLCEEYMCEFLGSKERCSQFTGYGENGTATSNNMATFPGHWSMFST